MRYYGPKLDQVRRWVRQRTEYDNYYYELTSHNRADLASVVALVCGLSPEQIEGYIRELTEDVALRNHIRAYFARDDRLEDSRVAFGRREGWYAFVRALKPRVVIETGVHHGVGACVLSAALIRNHREGAGGRYYGTDINPKAGDLFTLPYSDYGEIIYGDSVTAIRDLGLTVDIFVNDSDHSPEYEELEYSAVAPTLGDKSLILGDNAHVSSELNHFSRRMGRPFLFFREEPHDHWYPGAGIGISPARIPLVA